MIYVIIFTNLKNSADLYYVRYNNELKNVANLGLYVCIYCQFNAMMTLPSV